MLYIYPFYQLPVFKISGDRPFNINVRTVGVGAAIVPLTVDVHPRESVTV